VALSVASKRIVLHDVVGAVPGKKYSLVVRVVQAPGSSPVLASMVISSSPVGFANAATGSLEEISVK
jgi:hypothetical protein